jgi:two-component sensor histidine kinase
MPRSRSARFAPNPARAFVLRLRRASLRHARALSAGATLLVFCLDYVTPADFVVGVFYLIAMVLAAETRSRSWLACCGLAAILLTILAGLVGAPPLDGTSAGTMWTNRGLTLLALLGLLPVLDGVVILRASDALLRREVDHRAKNVLAVVTALLRVAPRDHPQVFAGLVEERVQAIARVHSLLAEAQWEGADLRMLAQRELAPYASLSGRLRLDGPAVQINATAAQPLGMFLHELATNSAKHGAFSVPTGSLHLRWRVDPASADLLLEWTELGGPPIERPPERRGFGTRLMAGLIRQIGGSMEHAWQSNGLRCLIRVPCATFAVAD